MVKKNILVICTTGRDRRELTRDFFSKHYTIHFQKYDDSILDKILCGCVKDAPVPFNPILEIDELLQLCEKNFIDAVVSTDDYPGSIFSSIIANHLQLPGPSPHSVLTCQHKYYSRLAEQKFVPQATPKFTLIDPAEFNSDEFPLKFPVFIKPVKSYFSINAHKVYNKQELITIVKEDLPPELFLQRLNWFLKNYSTYNLSANYLLAETLLEGEQICLEGYVYKGEVTVIGIVDSRMYPGTFSFQSFDYPSCLPESVQQQMINIAEKFITGIAFDNSLFNVEMMYNPKTQNITIIEVNPRMCSQFADLYEKVDGYNTYQTMIDIALGNQPSINHRAGKFKIASSFVLRVFENKQVKHVPTPQDLEKFYQEFPEARVDIHVKEGDWLDSLMQDGKSYRYALIHLGATTQEELLMKFETSKNLLAFEFV